MLCSYEQRAVQRSVSEEWAMMGRERIEKRLLRNAARWPEEFVCARFLNALFAESLLLGRKALRMPNDKLHASYGDTRLLRRVGIVRVHLTTRSLDCQTTLIQVIATNVRQPGRDVSKKNLFKTSRELTPAPIGMVREGTLNCLLMPVSQEYP